MTIVALLLTQLRVRYEVPTVREALIVVTALRIYVAVECLVTASIAFLVIHDKQHANWMRTKQARRKLLTRAELLKEWAAEVDISGFHARAPSRSDFGKLMLLAFLWTYSVYAMFTLRFRLPSEHRESGDINRILIRCREFPSKEGWYVVKARTH